jgi:hypothetical protein
LNGVQLDTVFGARLVPSRSTGKCKSSLKSFYEPVSANGAAASWDNSRSDGRADSVALHPIDRAVFASTGWCLISKQKWFFDIYSG